MSSILKVSEIQDTTGKKILQNTGGVLQVKQQVYSTYTGMTSSSYADTGITLAITPTSTSSKILIITSMQCSNGTGQNANETGFQFVRGSTSIRTFERAIFAYNQGSDNIAVDANISLVFLDSPSTTSATTYKVQAKVSAGTMRINDYATANNKGCSTFTLMEISA
jgi:hypothetical protein